MIATADVSTAAALLGPERSLGLRSHPTANVPPALQDAPRMDYASFQRAYPSMVYRRQRRHYQRLTDAVLRMVNPKYPSFVLPLTGVKENGV